MAHLLNQHSSLMVTVGDHLGDVPVFLRLESIDLQQLIRVVPIKSSTEIDRVIELEHNEPFDLSDNTSPLWRLTIAPIEDDSSSFYLMFIIHHAICDGRSGMVLTEQLIELLNSKPRQLESTEDLSPSEFSRISITSSIPISVPMEDRFNCHPSIHALACELAKQLPVPKLLRKVFETKYWAGEIDSSREAPNVTELRLLQLTKQETSKVVQAAKRRSTTVQAILYMASVFATKSVFVSNTKEAINFGTVVSVRDKIPNPISRSDLGNYISIIPHNNIYIQGESDFWSMARIYRAQVVSATSTTSKIHDLMNDLGLLDYLPKKASAWEEAIKSDAYKAQHGRDMSVVMSNLGCMSSQQPTVTSNSDAPCESTEILEYLMDDAIFSQSAMVNNTALIMSVVTGNGKMSVTTAWQKSTLKERARGNLFVSEFKRILFEAIDDGRESYLFKDAK
ncbi:hypothetical protein BGX26_002195 [Mortierella sp. AD094]|nr:hypothetical protein BGX26_002195 [Mortierella sp. AD094]